MQGTSFDLRAWVGGLPPGMTGEEFESLCTRCAKCCYQKIIVGRTVIITPFPCRFLDTEAKCCTVYQDRQTQNPQCLGVLDGLKVSAFPDDCPYVEAFAPVGYRPAVDRWSWEGQWKDFDNLADDLNVPDHIREAVRAKGPQARLPWEEADTMTKCCSQTPRRDPGA